MSLNNSSTDSSQTRAADQLADSADPDRNLALELVRATEAAALACAR